MSVKIHDKMPSPLQGLKQGSGTLRKGGPGTSPQGESVELTPQARQLKALEEALAREPAIDAARVASIKAAIEAGTYPIDTRRLAENILKAERLLFGG